MSEVGISIPINPALQLFRNSISSGGMVKLNSRDSDKLFLLLPNFENPAYPGQRFYCWHCALMEGVLASFPELAQRLEVKRIAWPRPRYPIIALVGEENQSLPLLVLADGATSAHQTGTYQGRAFISEKGKILAALSERHGFPDPHP